MVLAVLKAGFFKGCRQFISTLADLGSDPGWVVSEKKNSELSIKGGFQK